MAEEFTKAPVAEEIGVTEAETTEAPEKTGPKYLLFGRWDLSEVQINDPGLVRYVSLDSMIVPHSCGRMNDQRFLKSDMLIVERMINKLMQTADNTGKKELTTRIVKDAFEIIYKKTGKNPVEVFVDAVAKIPNETKWIVSRLFKTRYELYAKELTGEIPFVEGVVQALNERIVNAKGCVVPSVENLTYLKKQLEDALLVLAGEGKKGVSR